MNTPDLSKPSCEPFFRTGRQKHKNSADKREGMDAAYLGNISKLPCCIPTCRRTEGVEAHHVRFLDPNRAKGKKPLDRFALPLCGLEHHRFGIDAVHNVGTRQEANWFWQHEIDATLLTDRLWKHRSSLEDMRNILFTHWERRP